jgi:pimeloyl-ACP methyl ester carboxylesterase
VIGVLGIGLVLALALPAFSRADERVDITAMDGAQLIGDLAGTSGPGVVLVHGQRHDRRVWEAAAHAIAARGFRTLRFDLRGHGDSNGSADVTARERDVEGAFRYLLARKIRPVFLVGEGIGGTAALIAATRVPVAGVVALALPPATQVPDPTTALPNLRAPILFLTHDPDPPRNLTALAPQSRVVKLSGPVDLSSSEVVEALIAFLSDPKGAPPEPK